MRGGSRCDRMTTFVGLVAAANPPTGPLPSPDGDATICAMERATATRAEFFDVDREGFAGAFARHSTRVHHSLSDHPLLTLDRPPPRL